MDKEKYPKMMYAYAILLDNKIENWSVSSNNRRHVGEFGGYWNFRRIMDYKLQKSSWFCKKNIASTLEHTF